MDKDEPFVERIEVTRSGTTGTGDCTLIVVAACLREREKEKERERERERESEWKQKVHVDKKSKLPALSPGPFPAFNTAH